MVKGKQRVNLFINPKVVEDSKIHAAKNLLSLSQLVENALKSIVTPSKKISDQEAIKQWDKMFKEYQEWKKNRKE